MWLYAYLTMLASGSIINFKEVIPGPGILVIHKYLMFTQSDIYGPNTPFLKATCKIYLGTSSRAEGFIGVLTSKEYHTLDKKDPCFTSFPESETKVQLSGGSFFMNIRQSQLYYVLALVCEGDNVELDIQIEAMNPYGQVPGDLVYLIPVIPIQFYLVLAGVYLLLLLAWSISLLIYFKYSIPVQRYWIPLVISLCTLEYLINFWDWEVFNTNGTRSWIILLIGIIIKAFRDSLVRILLMAAAKGLGISWETIKTKPWVIYASGISYFVFDAIYEGIARTHDYIDLWLLLLISFPLILLNTAIFYLIFSWFAQTFYRLNFLKQNYKLKLLKQFAYVLGFAGIFSVLWGVLEHLGRFFLTKERIWKWTWLYIGIWDIIFLMVVISLMVIWRVSENSKLLAVIQELRDDDNELSHEEEAKYGIELSKV